MANELTFKQGGDIEAMAISAEMYNRFLAYIDATPQTVEAYRRALKPFFRYLAENNISRPLRADLMAYRDGLKAHLAAATVQLYITALRRFFTWVEQEGLYKNEARDLKSAKRDEGHMRDDLSASEAGNVLNGIDRNSLTGKRDYAIISAMATAGLRTIEVTRANIEDMREKDGRMVLYVQGKGREDRVRYSKLYPEAVKAIMAYLEARPEASGKDPLFASESDRNRGGRLTTKSISRLAKERLINAGLNSSRKTAHSFRHTMATIALEQGKSIAEVQQALGHKHINTTMIYIHSIDRKRNNTEDVVGAAIFSKMENARA